MKMKKILTSIVIFALLMVCVDSFSRPISVSAQISNVELMDDQFVWRYLDDHTDPNVGTWYEEWNKRNGWAYPLDFLDWGTYPMRFSDETWSDGVQPFSFDEQNSETVLKKKDDGTAGSTYFFRGNFNLDDPSQIVAISGTVRYNDAAIVYINGKPIESLLNIPISNYSQNLEYGCTEKVTEEYQEVSFIVEDVSSLLEGDNVIAVELHTSDENDQDAYFEMVSFVLNPTSDQLPETEAVKNIAVNVGEDESQLNLAWYALSSNPGKVQIALKSQQQGTEFPESEAITINAFETGDAYTKFYDKKYYYNKVVIDNIERNQDYIYRVGNEEAWSDVYDFSTQDISEGHEILFVSDAQIGTGTIPTDKYGWNNTLSKAFELYPNISFIANPGDMVDVAYKESEYDGYFSTEYLMNYPSATTVGNHDIAANYSYHFNEPNLSGLGGDEANSDYYFIYGDVLYMVLNGNNTNNVEHARFIEETINATSDQSFDWKIVMFHQSLYSAATQSDKPQNIQRREELVPVLDQFDIDIALMGHDHCYVRTHHLENFEILDQGVIDENGYEINPEGTLYLTMSSASGSKYYDLIAEYDYSAVQYQLYVPTFSHIKITKDTFTMVAYRSDTMEVIDQYSMKKVDYDYNAGLLEYAIEYAKNLVKKNGLDGLGEEATTRFNEAVAQGESMIKKLADKDATINQQTVDQVAYDILSEVVQRDYYGDLTTLEDLVELVKDYPAANYTETSYQVFKTALDRANEVIQASQNDPASKTDQIATAWKDLVNALLKLETIANKDQLEALIEQAKDLDSSLYTEESYQKLQDEIAKAESVCQNPNATTAEVEQQIKDLQKAIDQLVKKQGTTDPDPTPNPDPENPTPPVDNTKPGNNGQSPETMDSHETSLIIGLLLASLFISMPLIYQKRRINRS